MSKRLKVWSLAGGASLVVGLVAVTSLILTRGDRRVDHAAADAHHETQQNGRLTAGETWRQEHDTLTRPLIEQFRLVQRKQDAMLIWMQMVSRIQGWPPPPEPASLPLPADPGPGLYAAEEPNCSTGCP